MATESPARIVESSKDRIWMSSKDVAIFGSPFKSMAAEELGILLKGHNFHREQAKSVPNRSGSAPPSMEGSFAAISNILAQQDCSLDSSLASLSSALENCESEEQLRADPTYLAYYCSNVNLNPRLPPPLISRENRRLVHHIGGFSNNWRLASLDDNGNGSMLLSRGSLSTHAEEPEDDSSTGKASDSLTGSDIAPPSGQNTAFHKSLVDLIQDQEDFPRTPSPVFTHSISSSHATTTEGIDSDVHGISLNISSLNISEVPESNSISANVCPETSALATTLISNDVILKTFPSPNGISSPKNNERRVMNVRLEDNTTADGGILGPDLSRTESRIRPSNIEISRNKQEQQSYWRSMPHPYPSIQGVPYQVHGVQAQVISQGMNHQERGVENLPHSYPKFFSADVQPTFQSSALSPPLYATAAAYMTPGNPFCSNFQPSGLFGSQYNMGGYALGSTIFPPFMPGYPSHGAVPMPFDGTSGASFKGEDISHVGDLQHVSKLYGQPGLAFQPSYVDPLHMQYSSRPVGDPYGGSLQHGQLASGGLSPMQVHSFSQQDSNVIPYMCDQKLQSPTSGGFTISSPRKVVTGTYRGSPSNTSFMPQFPASPLSSPAVPSSPVGGVRRNEMRFPQGSVRNAGVVSGWQGQRGVKGFDDPKRHSFLEELKSSNSRKFELSDIAGRIVEFSVDQHGSRFIQQKLEYCSPEDKASVFYEVLPHASKLMTDVFGNYVIQKFFEHGTPEQRKELADQLSGQMLPLSLQMYGCRVIQKALEVIELDQKTRLVHELDGHVMRCVRDQNGNHVIQKCIECVPTEQIGFIISSFRGQVATLSTHPYGCRVIQRVLEHCSDEQQTQCIVDEILEATCVLAQDQYGNYVTQHVLERGKPQERSQIISKLSGEIAQMSQHKYASNVVEKCIEYGDTTERELLIEEIIGRSEENDNLLIMMKDQFANYVIQKIIEISNEKQREKLLNHIKVHLNALKKYTYGKHIVTRFEQLSGEENQALES